MIVPISLLCDELTACTRLIFYYLSLILTSKASKIIFMYFQSKRESFVVY